MPPDSAPEPLSADEFQSLRAEWNEIVSRRARLPSTWLPAFNALRFEEARLRADGRWVHGPDDFLGVLGLARSEVCHSRMLAWLLDPCAAHGLGDRVLAGVLRASFADVLPAAVFDGLGAALTTCEFQRDGARIDVLVRSDSLTLVIENKVDSPEGDGQCDAYFHLFRNDRGVRFLFLTPSGYSPLSASGEARDEFRTLGYVTLRGILQSALEVVPGDGFGALVARSYLRTLSREFS